jgi:hypothetical protein
MSRPRLEVIEEGALDSSLPLADALRQRVALANQPGSDAVREWARLELTGYPKDVEPPVYRRQQGL